MNMSEEIFGQSRVSCPCSSIRLMLTGKSFPILGCLSEKSIIGKSFPFSYVFLHSTRPANPTNSARSMTPYSNPTK
jgi:hypothetical protein